MVLNNVVADMNANQSTNGFFGERNRGQNIVPSLGLLWSNCINERICLRKKMGHGNEVKRTMLIEKSSFMRKSDIEFEINN